ncbi:MAG TPA: Hpt domain-containing protein [Thermoanaerobaculia bacterium]|nr:Hpt domain-containing protein [Thermoanaerobaculia bacterium]
MVDYELNELRREFLDEARAKVAEMQTALETSGDSRALERVAYLAHQLKGSGGSYGYQRISTDAAEVEKAVESLVEQASESPAVEAKIQQHVVSLRSEIEGALRSLA